MIYRLDKPSAQATFSNGLDGLPPMESKWSLPYNSIRYTNTVYTAPSNGLTAYWYRNTSCAHAIPRSTAYTGNMPLMKNWYGNGLPPVFTINDITNNRWSTKYRGYFRFDYPSTYRFYFGGEGHITKFLIDGNNTLSANLSTTEKRIRLTDTAHATSNAHINVTPGVWKEFELCYEQRSAFENINSGLVVLWQTTDTIATPEKIVMSAGVTNTYGGGIPAIGAPAILDTAIPEFLDVSLNVSENQGSTFTFTVPFISSANSISSAGFYYDPGTESYLHINQKKHPGFNLRKFRKIVYNEGYIAPGNIQESVQRFSGQIRDFNVKLQKNGGDTLEVVCHDYSILAREQFNVDAPNPIDYIAAGYMSPISAHVNGETKPPAFDGWELHKAFEIMAMNSYLDPYYMSLRERKSRRDGLLLHGNYFVEPKGLEYDIWLDRDPIFYGNPYGTEPNSQAIGAVAPVDSKYLYPVDFGEYYQDAITKFTSIYGMQWGVNRFGYPFLKTLDVPRSYADARNTSKITYAGIWTNTGKNINSFRAVFSSSLALHASASATFTGSRCKLLVGLGPRNGSHTLGNTSAAVSTIYTNIRKGGVLVEQNKYNLYLSTAWHYYNGIYPGLGRNPAILNIGNNLTYDTYTVHVGIMDSTSKYAELGGFLFYDDDLDGPKAKFRTGDSKGPGQVSELTNIDTGEDLRNEAYVLGRFVDYTYKASPVQADRPEDSIVTSVVNPKNPEGRYVQSVTRDIDSIYKSTASNFVGMPKRTLIADPSIASQSQADYLSLNFVQQYANPPKDIELVTIGNPLLEINDKVTIEDNYSQVVDSAKSFWIKGQGSDFSDTFTSNYDVTTFRPIGSFFQKIQPDVVNQFGGVPLLNLRVENRGTPSTRLNAPLTKTATNEISLTTVTGLPARGYLYLQKFAASTGNKVYEIIKYGRRDADGINPGKVYELIRGLQYSSSESWTSADHVIGAYDPYLQEGSGIVPTVKFDSLINGKVYIEVVGIVDGLNTHVNTLTGIGSEQWPFNSFDPTQWGPNQVYVWDCRDALGDWNKYHAETLLQTEQAGGINYYVAEKHDVVPYGVANGRPLAQQSPFYLNFKFIGDDGNVWNYSTKDSDGRLISTACVYTRRGPVGKANFHIQWKGCWYPNFEYGHHSPSKLGYSTNARIAGMAFTWCSTNYPGRSTAIPRFGYINSTSWSYANMGAHSAIGLKPIEVGNFNKVWPFQKTLIEEPVYGGHRMHVYMNDKYGNYPLVFFTSTSNGGDGLHIILRSGGNIYNEKSGKWPEENLTYGWGDFRIQELLDPDYRRHYSLGLKWRKNILSYMTGGGWDRILGQVISLTNPGTSALWGTKGHLFHEKVDGDLLVDESITHDLYNGGKGIKILFNPKKITEGPKYDFAPKDALIYYRLLLTMLGYVDGYLLGRMYDDNSDGNPDRGNYHRDLYFINYVNFWGELMDNSGRKPIVYGDLYSDPSKTGGATRESAFGLTKFWSDEASTWRYDENPKRRVVGYVDFEQQTMMENEQSNNLPNVVLAPIAAEGVDDISKITGYDPCITDIFPWGQWQWRLMWWLKRE